VLVPMLALEGLQSAMDMLRDGSTSLTQVVGRGTPSFCALAIQGAGTAGKPSPTELMHSITFMPE